MKSSPPFMDSVENPLADLITSISDHTDISNISSDILFKLEHEDNETVIFENAEDKTPYLLIINPIESPPSGV